MSVPQFLFTHSLDNGHLLGFQFFAIINKAHINIYEQLHEWSYVLILLHEYLGMELLSHIGGICITS